MWRASIARIRFSFSKLPFNNYENTSSGSFAALVLETQDKSDVETETDSKVGKAGMETTRTSYFMETVAYNLQSEMW